MVTMYLDTDIQNETGIVTLGYEGKKLDQFLQILKGNNVQRLIDVRNNPFSLKPGFSKSPLAKALESVGISYLHMPELGIESRRRRNKTKEGLNILFQIYEHELKTKVQSLNAINKLSQKEKVALMCFEANAADCHRSIIAKQFRSDGIPVVDL